MRRESELKPPILLLGNVRSGTSMTMFSFDTHPNICVWNEPRVVWVYADPGRRHDRFTEEDATPRVRRYIRKRFFAYQRAHGDLRVMEKTPSNVLRARYLHAIFPESKFLYIIREPLANLSSSEYWWRKSVNPRQVVARLRTVPKTQLHYYFGRFMQDFLAKRVLRRPKQTVWGVRYPGIYEDIPRMSTEEIIAKQWVKCAQFAEEDLARIPEELVMRIRYEEFVADPVNVFDRVLRHFDEEMTPGVAAKLREMIDPNRQTKWRRLDPRVLARAVPILEEEMRRQGYSVPGEVREMLREFEGSGGRGGLRPSADSGDAAGRTEAAASGERD